MDNWMRQKLLPHVGHEISCVAYGDRDDPSDVCIECEDCYTVLVSAEDFNQDMAGDYKITQRLRIGGRTLLMGHNPEDKEAPYLTNAGGRAVFFQELYSGEKCRWEIGDVLGIADMDKLPDWAKAKVEEREQQKEEGKK